MSVSLYAQDSQYYYITKTQDWPAKILRKIGICPDWKKQDNLTALKLSNPEMYGQKIKPDQKLIIPKNVLQNSNNSYYQIKNNELITIHQEIDCSNTTHKSDKIQWQYVHNPENPVSHLNPDDSFEYFEYDQRELSSIDENKISIEVQPIPDLLKKSKNIIELRNPYRYYRLDSVDLKNSSTAQIGSELTPGIGLGYTHKWNNSWHSTFDVDAIFAQFNSTDNRQLNQDEKLFIDANVKMDYQITSTKLSLGLGSKEQAVVFNQSGTTLNIFKQMQPYLLFSFDRRFFTSKNFNLILDGEYRVLSSSSGSRFNLESSSSWSIQLRNEILMNQWLLKQFVGWNSTELNTSDSQQTNDVLLFGIGAQF